MTCLACDVLAGRTPAPGGVIHETEHWVVDHSISPVRLRGWLVAKPRRHVEAFGDLSNDEASELGPLARSGAAAIESALGAERVYVCSFGEEWRHVHVHFVPRYPGQQPQSWELLGLMWSDESPWACSDADAAEAAESVRRAWR